MLYRDLAERFSIKNPSLLKYLLKYMVVNLAQPISMAKTFNDLKSQGYALSKNTVYDYVSYLEEIKIEDKTIFVQPAWSCFFEKS